jgi:hypothetical protein
MAGPTDAERLRTAEVTLATIAEHARALLAISAPGGGNEHARGYDAALRDIVAILDARWLPEGHPVVLSSAWP